MTPSSSGSRSPSSAAGANSPSSSRNSTPPWLKEISPGSQRRRAAADEGDRRRRVVRRPERRAGDEPAARHRHARPPSGPSWPPARRRGRAAAAGPAGAGPASSCRSRAGRPAAGGDRRRRRSRAPAGRRAARARRRGRAAAARRRRRRRRGRRATAPRRASAPTTSASVRRHAHVRAARPRAPRRPTLPGTTASTSPSTATIGATPGTRRSVPSSPSSPTKPSPSAAVGRQLLGGDRARRRRSPGRARRRPCAGPTGARLTVIAFDGQSWPALITAARTRSRDSRHAGSGWPTMRKPGQALADVDLDAHRDAGRAEQAGGRDGSEHDGPPTDRLIGSGRGGPARRRGGRRYRGGCHSEDAAGSRAGRSADRPCQTRSCVRVPGRSSSPARPRSSPRRPAGGVVRRRRPGRHGAFCGEVQDHAAELHDGAGDARRHRRVRRPLPAHRRRRAAGHRGRTGRRWCSTTRRRAPSTRPTRSRSNGRWRRPTRPSSQRSPCTTSCSPTATSTSARSRRSCRTPVAADRHRADDRRRLRPRRADGSDRRRSRRGGS